MQQVVSYKNRTCIMANMLWESGIITRTNYDKMVIRKKLDIVQRGCRNNPALISWNSFPDDLRMPVIRVLNGDPGKMVKRENPLKQYLSFNDEAERFFSTYLIDGKDRHLPSDTQKEYLANAEVLDAIRRFVQNAKSRRQTYSVGGTAESIWEAAAKAAEALDRSQYPHRLPRNARSLQKKYKRYAKDGFKSLIHDNFMNRSAAIIKDEVQEAFLLKLISNYKNYNDEQIAEMYNITAEFSGWKPVGAGAVAPYRIKHHLETFPGRQGLKEFSNRMTMQAKRYKPTLPLLFWSLDGWEAELLYQQIAVDGKGNRVTTYFNRLTVVTVLDPSCDYIAGYAIGSHETPALITEALRNAANHTAELFGRRYQTAQVQSDRYQIAKLSPVYDSIGAKVTPAAVGNAKAKPVERFFAKFNEYLKMHFTNWSGYNVTSKKDNQPNDEWLDKRKRDFPDEAGCRMQIIQAIEAFRKEKIEKYMELWSKMSDDKKILLSDEQYLYTFGNVRYDKRKELITNTLTGAGVIAAIGGEEHTYDCFDINFRKHSREKWILRFDPDDLTKVLATSKDGSLRYMLEEKYVQPMALADRKPGDSEELQKVRNYNKELVEYITDFNVQRDELVSEHFQKYPELNDTLLKHLITDSRGQHKDERNRQLALSAARKAEIKTAKKREAEEAESFADERSRYLKGKVNIEEYLQTENQELIFNI